MSENLKLRLDSPSGEPRPDASRRPPEPGAGGLSALGASGRDTTGRTDHTGSAESGRGDPDRVDRNPNSAGAGGVGLNDEAESQMRKALGLLGEPSRHRADNERMDQPARMGDRFNGGLHRRRFVQDGDIPVTVLRRDQNHEAPAHRSVTQQPAAPTSSRLQRTEAMLAAETAAREKAERSLSEAHSIVRDLQTKIGHAELAKSEAIETLRRERESNAQYRAEFEAVEERLAEALEQVRMAERNAHSYQEQLAEERHARKLIEKALRAAESARDTAEQLVRTLSEENVAPRPAPQPYRRPAFVPEPPPAAAVTRRGRPPETPAMEPEPVKWWLNTKASGKKR